MYKVLVVDDVSENISLIINILQKEYQVIASSSSNQALHLAQKALPDLILLDILMPIMDGYELCRELKKSEITKDIPIIFLTILDEITDVEKGFNVGGVDYITKPFEPSILKARVKTHCELANQKKELYRFNNELKELVQEKVEELHKAQLHSQMLARQASMGNLIAMVAHQWKQPISTIAMIVNNILVDIELQMLNNSKLRENMLEISRYVEYLSETIDNFKNFFKPRKDKELVSIIELFEIVNNMIRASLQNSGIKLDIRVDEDISFNSYKNELLQVILNIISNSKDAIVANKIENGFIDVVANMKDDNVEIEICDNGGGIGVDIIDKLGEPYFSTKDKSGTGLGLYMSKSIVEKHLNGELKWFNSDSGACFKITFSI